MVLSYSSIWSVAQHSLGGEYTSDRRDSLRRYQQRTSATRAFFVCVLTPLPALTFAVVSEAAFPLLPVDRGWNGTINLSLRYVLTSMTLALSVMNLARRFIPELRVSLRQLVLPAMVTASLHTAYTAMCAMLWVFPVPFTTVQTAPVFTGLLLGSFLGFLGTAPFREIPQFKHKLKLYVIILLLLNSLNVAYPAYAAFYRTQSSHVQLFIVVLPILIKNIAKVVLARLVRALGCDDFVPEATQCSIELLHALFVTVCIQTTSQPLRITLVLLLFDFLPLLGAYRHIRATASVGRLVSLHHIYPTPSAAGPHNRAVKQATARGRRRQACRALYLCENHMLIEYIESMTVLIYAAFTSILYNLPNAKYYEVMHSVQTPARLVRFLASTLTFAALQLTSLVYFSYKISRLRELGNISGIHVLSFVLESQREMVQSWFFLWIPLCIQAMVEHSGADYTLRFAWIKPSNQAETVV